ncbi:MAG: DNA methyltransferase [Nostoc sp.]|uniref:DNA methyltransferase n=1 Tax=Nostoc sp. TaxID=1180 RepID=UPI002FFB13A3
MKLPVHRWFRFSAGFSAQSVETIITQFQERGEITVLDPFADSGTTLLASEKLGVECFGIEAHPFVARIARAKLLYQTDSDAYLEHIKKVTKYAENLQPCVETYPKLFTQGALDQLESKGFKILYLKYENIVKSFTSVGINASFNESTLESEFQNKIEQWKNLSTPDINNIKNQILSLEKYQIDKFINILEKSFTRLVQQVNIIVLHGLCQQAETINNAIEYIQNYSENQPKFAPAIKYEIDIRYNNGDIIHAMFKNKTEALKFLRTFV